MIKTPSSTVKTPSSIMVDHSLREVDRAPEPEPAPGF